MHPPIDHPTVAGDWRIRGGTLTCRLPRGSIEVRAPRPLLQAVQASCAGTLDWHAVVDRLGRRWRAHQVGQFLQGLALQGALVDRDDAQTLQAARHRTFGEAALSATHLRLLLQQAARWRGIRWRVEVLRVATRQDTAWPWQQGAHWLATDASGQLALRPIAGGAPLAWQVLPDPRLCRHASIVLLPHGSPARALRALCALQRAATSLGVGHNLQQALQDPGTRPARRRGGASAALVLGTPAKAADATAQQVDDWLDVGQAASWFGTPLRRNRYAYAARPIGDDVPSLLTVGRSNDPGLALRKAEAEAWERRGWATLGTVVEGAWQDLPGARRPNAVVAYAEWQHRRPGFPFPRFRPDSPRLWRHGVEVGSGSPVLLPAECIHALDALPTAWQQRACTAASTSGVAAGPDDSTAFTWALLELVERDAFLRAWLSRMPAPVVAPATLPADALRRVRALRALGHRVDVLRLPALAPVYGVLVQATRRPFTVVTAAAHFDPEEALAKALDEAEGCAAHARAHRLPPLGRAGAVHSIRDLHRYWQSPGAQHHADFLRRRASPVDFLGSGLVTDSPSLLSALACHGHDVLAFDLTPPGAAIDQGRTPLRVVRAVVPGLLPIWFTHGLEPAGLPAYQAAAGTSRRAAPLHPFP